MNERIIRQACINVGLIEPISIEPDGSVWTGIDPDRVYADMKPILDECERLAAASAAEAQAKVAARESAIAKLSALGLDAEEITALLGV